MAYLLTSCRSTDSVTRLELSGSTVIIGRSEDATIQVDGGKASSEPLVEGGVNFRCFAKGLDVLRP